MADRFTVDACDWPIIINHCDSPDDRDAIVVAQFPLPEGSTGDDPMGLAQVERANAVCRFLNQEVARG